jgi:hypothetical protein
MNLTAQDRNNLNAMQSANGCTVGLVVGKWEGRTFTPEAPFRVLLPDGTERVIEGAECQSVSI